MGEPVKKQQGVVLVIALIALVAMSLAGIALMRTVDTTNVISGNLAFGEAAVQMEDAGASAAYQWVMNNIMSSGSSSCEVIESGGGTCSNNYYYHDALAIDPNTKLPMAPGGANLNWSPAVTSVTGGGALPTGYSVQYIIERMCGTAVGGAAQTNGAAATFVNCQAAPVYSPATIMNNAGVVQVTGITVTSTGTGYTSAPSVIFINSGTGGSGASATATLAGSAITNPPTITTGGAGYSTGPKVVFSSGGGTGASTLKANTGRLYFRVTVMVTGPRNTTGMAQYFLGFEDTVY